MPLAGLRLAPGGTQLTRTWIVYNKPKEPSYTHAGMLMGLGLTGAHLASKSNLIKATTAEQHPDESMTPVFLSFPECKPETECLFNRSLPSEVATGSVSHDGPQRCLHA